MARSEAANSKSNNSADFIYGLVLEIGQILQNILSIAILDVSVTFQHLCVCVSIRVTFKIEAQEFHQTLKT